MTKEELIIKYARDYRHTTMNEITIVNMLESFVEDLEEVFSEDEDVGDRTRER
jgi:hypothetical protein